jgi:hypothetical protein
MDDISDIQPDQVKKKKVSYVMARGMFVLIHDPSHLKHAAWIGTNLSAGSKTSWRDVFRSLGQQP